MVCGLGMPEVSFEVSPPVAGGVLGVSWQRGHWHCS